MKYVVETKFAHGFENCWTYNDETLITFNSREEAQDELDCYLFSLAAEHEEGLIDDFNPSDYRISEISE
jgi:hypothetical protein